MKSLWSDTEAAQYPGDLALRVYTSRLLGRDKSLVLHGGGNTSVKLSAKNAFGEDEALLYVKGSGWDLEKIEEGGFAPVRLEHLKRLALLPALPDPQMVNELVTQTTRAGAPVPSVEAILHAILPHKYVDHTHADAVLAVTNTADGAARTREIYGELVVVIPYVMPGFDLATLCAQLFPRDVAPATIGMVLLNHGIFSFGATARESYQRMIHLVDLAEQYLQRQGAWVLAAPQLKPANAQVPTPAATRTTLAALRRTLSAQAGAPLVLTQHAEPKHLAFAGRADIAALAGQGPATPDHVIRTKRTPMIGRDVAAFASEYRSYFAAHEPQAKERKTILDTAPRLLLDAELGMCAAGRSAKDAAIVAELYDHTIDVILRSHALGGYVALPLRDIFDVEYWDLEQAKLKKAGQPPQFTGEVALVTGAASGIGKACVAALLARGAAVVGADLTASVETMHQRPDYCGVTCDLTDAAQIERLLDTAVARFGGLDMLILNAGIFPDGRRIEALALDEWQRVMRINLDANLVLLRDCHPLLKLSPNGGRVVVIGSKNVPAPGPGAAAYSASKAALNQLVRVAALEWGADGIRLNSLHPNAVFDTGLWSDEVLASRAKHYGLSIEQYKTNNVLKTEVKSRDVAELAAEMCGPLFAKTTAAQVPVDGGNERVI